MAATWARPRRRSPDRLARRHGRGAVPLRPVGDPGRARAGPHARGRRAGLRRARHPRGSRPADRGADPPDPALHDATRDSAPLGLANPVWEDDPDFDPDRHVRPPPCPSRAATRSSAESWARRCRAARPLASAVGAPRGRGPRGRPHGARREDAPRARRRDRRDGRGTIILDPTPERLDLPPPPEDGADAQPRARAPRRAARPARGRRSSTRRASCARDTMARGAERSTRASATPPGARLGRRAPRARPAPPHRAGHATERRDRSQPALRPRPRTARRRQGGAARRRRDGERRPARRRGADALRVPGRRRAGAGRGAGPGVRPAGLGPRRARQPHLHGLRRPAAARRAP